MTYKLNLTFKYRINEYVAEDMDDLTEITSEEVKEVYNALESLGIREWDAWSEDVDGVRIANNYYLVSEETFDELKKMVNLDCVEVSEVD